jgi:hypothetical protein
MSGGGGGGFRWKNTEMGVAKQGDICQHVCMLSSFLGSNTDTSQIYVNGRY